MTRRAVTADPPAPLDPAFARFAFIRVPERSAQLVRDFVQMRINLLDIALQPDPFQLAFELWSVSAVPDVDHLMAHQRFQLAERSLLEQAADANEALMPVAGAPRAEHSAGPFAPILRQFPVPVSPVQNTKHVLQIEFPGKRIGEQVQLLHPVDFTASSPLF